MLYRPFEIRREVDHGKAFVAFGRFLNRRDAERRLVELQRISPKAKFTIRLTALDA